MPFDLEAPPPQPEEVELAPGVRAKILPLTGALACRADAEVASALASLRNGGAAASRFRLDAGKLTDPASFEGLFSLARAVVLATHTITEWTVTSRQARADHRGQRSAPVRTAAGRFLRLPGTHPRSRASAGGRPNVHRLPLLQTLAFVARHDGAARRSGGALRRLARHRFGRGGDYCRGCVKLNSPCSRGLPGSSGKYCPATADAPTDPDAVAVWRAILGHPGLLRHAEVDGVVMGVRLADLVAAAKTYGGGEAGAIQDMASYVEKGIVDAANEQRAHIRAERGE